MPNKSLEDARAVDIDAYDIAIISALSSDAELSTIELSKMVHLSRTAVARRITNLRDNGVIGPARVGVRYDKLGFSIRAFVEASAPRQDSFNVRDRLLERPEVLNLSIVLGEHLIIAEIIAVDTAHLHQFLTWLNDMGYSETKVILKQHESSIALRDRLRLIEKKRAVIDCRLQDEEPETPNK